MPKQTINFQNTIIYKLVCNDTNIKDCYIGHTTDFKHRKYSHKSKCNNKKNPYVYKFIGDNGGWNNWSMIMIEKYPCGDKLEAEKRERYWIEELKSKLNKVIPTRTKNEYNQTEKYKNAKKNYYDKNKDYIQKYKKEYFENNQNKIKQYLKENQDKIIDTRKIYRNAKIKCDRCNKDISRGYLINHKKRKHPEN
jgi:hypothetical protein